MPVLNEARHATEGLLSEASFHRSRDNIVVVAGSGKLQPGTVLGKLTASAKYKPATSGGDDGAQTAVAVLLYPVDATETDVPVAAITRDAEWNGKTLTYDPTVDNAAKTMTKVGQLGAVGIIVR